MIAADAGGTHSRVACFGLDGRLLGSATGAGGSPYHQSDAARNVATTTARALADASVDVADAVGLVAGLASISRPGSNQGDGTNDWARDFFRVPGLVCERTIVNDAVVAHRGALLGAPGVVVVAGTGSMILAIDERGTEVESGQFEHYAGAARHLAAEAVQLVLTGAATAEDGEVVAAVLGHWGVHDVAGLRRTLADQEGADPRQARHHYGALAPVITGAADASPLADRAVRDLAARAARGVRLVAPLAGDGVVPVATAGALAATPAFRARLADALAEDPVAPARLVPAALDALRGAAVLAYQRAGVALGQGLVDRLRDSQDLGHMP